MSRPKRATIRPAAFSILWLLLAFTLSSCALTGGDRRPILRVGVTPNYPPVIFEQDGQIVGIEADLARGVADEIGRRVVYERLPFGELLEAVERGDVDVVMSGLSISPERSTRVQFTEPFMEVGQLALIRTEDAGRLGRIQWIKRPGTRVGYERGTTGEIYVADHLPRSAAFAFDGVEDGLRSLRAGRIDYFVHDSPTIWHLAGNPSHRDLVGLYRPLTVEYVAWAVHPDNDQLASLLSATISHWRREGLIEPILNRWIPVRVRVP